MDHHVHRIARLGAGVLISERWYKWCETSSICDELKLTTSAKRGSMRAMQCSAACSSA